MTQQHCAIECYSSTCRTGVLAVHDKHGAGLPYATMYVQGGAHVFVEARPHSKLASVGFKLVPSPSLSSLGTVIQGQEVSVLLSWLPLLQLPAKEPARLQPDPLTGPKAGLSDTS